jgi:hypothetical protein
MSRSSDACQIEMASIKLRWPLPLQSGVGRTDDLDGLVPLCGGLEYMLPLSFGALGLANLALNRICRIYLLAMLDPSLVLLLSLSVRHLGLSHRSGSWVCGYQWSRCDGIHKAGIRLGRHA